MSSIDTSSSDSISATVPDDILTTLSDHEEIRAELLDRFPEYYIGDDEHEPAKNPSPPTTEINSRSRSKHTRKPNTKSNTSTQAQANMPSSSATKKATKPATAPNRTSPRTSKPSQKRKASTELETTPTKKSKKSVALDTHETAPSSSPTAAPASSAPTSAGSNKRVTRNTRSTRKTSTCFTTAATTVADTVTTVTTDTASSALAASAKKGKPGWKVTQTPLKTRAISSVPDVDTPASPTNLNTGRLIRNKAAGDKQMNTKKPAKSAPTSIPKTTPAKISKGKGKAAVKKSPAKMAVKKGGKGKAGRGATVDEDWSGTATGLGHSAEAPPDAPNDHSWSCAIPDCNSGQTWYAREAKGEKVKNMGRKTISHFFGRNKVATNLIPDDVWHWYCRKHYQRAHYNAHKIGAKGIANHQFDNLKHQLLRLKLWRPNAIFSVQLTKEMKDRSNIWQQKKRLFPNDLSRARDEFLLVKPKKVSGKRFDEEGNPIAVPDTPEEAFPVDQADAFEIQWCGDGRQYSDVFAVLAHIRSELDNNNLDHIPPVEFLINAPRPGELCYLPEDNYLRWRAAVEKSNETGTPIETVNIDLSASDEDDSDDADHNGHPPRDPDDGDDEDSDGPGLSYIANAKAGARAARKTGTARDTGTTRNTGSARTTRTSRKAGNVYVNRTADGTYTLANFDTAVDDASVKQESDEDEEELEIVVEPLKSDDEGEPAVIRKVNNDKDIFMADSEDEGPTNPYAVAADDADSDSGDDSEELSGRHIGVDRAFQFFGIPAGTPIKKGAMRHPSMRDYSSSGSKSLLDIVESTPEKRDNGATQKTTQRSDDYIPLDANARAPPVSPSPEKRTPSYPGMSGSPPKQPPASPDEIDLPSLPPLPGVFFNLKRKANPEPADDEDVNEGPVRYSPPKRQKINPMSYFMNADNRS